jgi:Helix-turn-helix domain
VSIEASSFVLGLSMGRGNGIRKLILLGYANHTDKHGRGAYPSIQTIADYAECDVRTVQRHIGWLITAGYLHEGDQRMVDHLDPRYRPIVYDVAMSSGSDLAVPVARSTLRFSSWGVDWVVRAPETAPGGVSSATAQAGGWQFVGARRL